MGVHGGHIARSSQAKTCHAIIFSHPDTRKTTGSRRDCDPDLGSTLDIGHAITQFHHSIRLSTVHIVLRSLTHGKKEGRGQARHPTPPSPPFPLLGRSSFELLSSDQPPRLKSGAKSFQPSARQSKSDRLCAFQASSPGLACEFIPTTCLPLSDILLPHQQESGRVDHARHKTSQLLPSTCISGPDVPAASREAPQCTSSSQLTGTGTPVTQWACMLPAMMPVGCNSVSLIGTSVGVTSAGPGDFQAKNLTRCRSPHAPCWSLRIRDTTDSPLKSRNAPGYVFTSARSGVPVHRFAITPHISKI